MKQGQRKAFTLIELLVVIAIIAILAAILFPVFAQAKRAAKGIAAVSNTKQLALAVIMYTNDYDDMWPLGEAWGESNAVFGFSIGHFLGFSPWSYTCLPYIKTSNLYIDPLLGGNDGYTPSPNLSQATWDAYNTEFGYDWCLLNGGFENESSGGYPGFPTTPVTQYSTTTTSLERPSDMVMLTESPAHTDPNYQPYFYCFWSAGCSTLDMIEGPFCDSGTSKCSDLSSYWGISNGWANLAAPASPTQNVAAYIEGSATSGVATRDNGLSTTAFTDGHSKAMTLGSLAVGTNWSPTFTKSQVQLTNNQTYRWWQY
jgi:prepilin-type N-terminal cleavage/methylation domain-containing protein